MRKITIGLVTNTLAAIVAVAMQFNAGWEAPAAHPDETRGNPWTGADGVQERTSEIMERPAPGRRVGQNVRIHGHGTTELVEYVQPVPEVPAQDAGVAAASGPTAQTVSTTFLGATLADCQAYPPDSMGAVGPAQFIVAVNGRIRSFNKSTGLADGVVNANTDTFFASVMTPPVANNFTSDPRIRYDRLARRWFIIMIDVPGQAGTLPNRIMIAVSDGPIITAGTVWSFFQFQHDLVSPAGDTGNFADYPTLGIDANALYIGVNIFTSGRRGSFDNTTVFVVRKSSILGVGPIVVTAFRGLIPQGNSGGPYTPQGVDNYDPNATEGYVVGVNSRFYDRMELRRISNPGGTPSISGNITINSIGNSATVKVPHLGNTAGAAGNLDGLDYRLMAAHVRNGRLWTSANLAVDNTGSPSGTDTRMGVRWWEIQGIATGQTPSIRQSGTVFDPSPSNSSTNRYYWMGSVMVSGQGHVGMGFSSAASVEYINAATCGRLANDPTNTMRAVQLYTTSTSAYNPRDQNGGAIDRWGDYSYTCLDPDDDMTMWTIQEWCSSPDYFGVQVAKLLAPGPAVPVSCSPATLTNGVSSVNVTLNGTSNGDTGFFDPGPGFSNRIAVAVSGVGVTVNSIVYSNPTNLTLNVSVSAGAAAGTRLVTVTNPDGQSAASASGILTIANTGSTNHPPSLPAIASQTVVEGTLLSFTNAATDPDADALTYTLAGAPTGAVIGASSGVFTWTPAESQGPATNVLSVIVTDNGLPNLSATQTFTVFVLETNTAPTLAAIANKTMVEGTLLTFTNSSTDPDLPANILTYTLAGAPTSAVIGASSGVFTWTPAESQAPATNVFSVIVTDTGVPNLSATQTFTVFVVETNTAPTLAAIADQTVHAGALIQFTNNALDSDLPADVLTFSLQGGAPPGATVNPSNGVFMWLTADADANTTNLISVVVADNGLPGLSASRAFTATVLPRPRVQSVVISNAEVILTWSAIAGRSYQLQTNSVIDAPSWGDAGTTVTATGPNATASDAAGGATRFYRVRVVP